MHASDLTIRDVRVHVLDFGPYPKPFRNSIIESRTRGMVLVEVEAANGVVGVAAGGDAGLMHGRLRSLLIGRHAREIEALWQAMFRGNRKPTVEPALLRSIGALDIALWDLSGKAAGVPTYHLLGAYRTRIPAYAAGGYYAEGKGISELVDEMERYAAQGYKAVKMKIGGAPLREDVERVRAVRKAIGPDVELMIDANNAWRADEAIRFGRAVADLDIYWFEEPVAPDDLAGTLAVRRALNMPVAAGENLFTRYQFRDFVAQGALDVVQADILLCGGYTEWRKIAALAGAYHLAVSPHGSPTVTAHVVAATPEVTWIETYPEAFAPPVPILHGPPVEGGEVVLTDAPGLGVEVDWEAVKRYRVGEAS